MTQIYMINADLNFFYIFSFSRTFSKSMYDGTMIIGRATFIKAQVLLSFAPMVHPCNRASIAPKVTVRRLDQSLRLLQSNSSYLQ